ncbi:MAG TPA: tetratricopeptide repeat protein [Terriglobia bacterium]|nr:tetratricopeptide repeat protein [Terriglobia bacterium]
MTAQRYRTAWRALALFFLLAGTLLWVSTYLSAQSSPPATFNLAVFTGSKAPTSIVKLLTERRFAEAQEEARELAAKTPQDASMANLEGVTFLLVGNLTKAEAFFHQSLRLNPQFLLAYRNLGITFWHEHKMADAQQAFTEALRLDSADPVANLYEGQIAFARHDCAAAAQSFNQSGETLLSLPVAVFMDAVCHFQLGQPQKAALLLGKMGKNPAIPYAPVFRFALEAGKQRSFPVALAALKLLPDDYPDPYTHGYDEALAAYESGDDTASVAMIRRMLSRGLGNAELYNLLGNALEDQGIAHKQPNVIKQAYEAYRKGIYTDPHNLANFIDIGRLALKLGNYDLGEELLTQGLAQNPQAYQLMLERGIAYAFSSHTREAAVDFANARRLAPDDPMPYMASGILAIQEGHNAQAAAALQEGIDRAHPANAWLYYLLARALYKQGHQTPETETRIRAALQEAIQLNPSFAEAYGLAGHVWLKSGQPEQAVKFLQAAHRLDPQNSHYVYELAVAQRMQGDSEDAARDFQKFRDLEAVNNPARIKKYFIKIFVDQPSAAGFQAMNDRR